MNDRSKVSNRCFGFPPIVLLTLLSVSAFFSLNATSEASPDPQGPDPQGDVSSEKSPPNILWITSEDNGPELGCYGDNFATSPNIDSLAKIGLRYNACWSNAPVCAPARTTIVTGMYASTLGASNMRSRVQLPQHVKLLPQFLREAGYYCTNNHKEDYNFGMTFKPWDESSNRAHWRNRPEGAPFFAVFNINATHESQIRKRPHVPKHRPEEVNVPPYHPDLPEVRQDWAQYYDKIQEMDARVGQILNELKVDGLSDSTIVFYFGDHGSGMPRSKRWLYQSGLRVPLVIHIPEKYLNLAPPEYQSGGVSERVVSFVDLVPSVLTLAGVEPADNLQGTSFMGKSPPPSEYLFGFRDRMDERIDMSRAIRNDRFLYIRNFYPQLPQGVWQHYMFQTPTTRSWKRAFESGSLNESQQFFWRAKPVEELYDIQSDPFQLVNLAESSKHTDALRKLRETLFATMIRTRDRGVIPEAILKSTDGVEINEWQESDWTSMVQAAFESTSNDSITNNALVASVNSDNPVVRFWVARGLLYRALSIKLSVTEKDSLLGIAKLLVTDKVPSVQLPAAAAACVLTAGRTKESLKGPDAGVGQAEVTNGASLVTNNTNENAANFDTEESRVWRDIVLQHADAREHGLLQAIAALNVIHELAIYGYKLSSTDLLKLQQNPRKDPELEQVYQELISRLLEGLTSQESR